MSELARLLETDPTFSPLAELVLEKERVLGEGGMGVVHLVLDRSLGRHAALKLIKGDATERATKRFLREAAITARLDHPGIPPVHAAGRTASGQHFLLMRYVAGSSLQALLREDDASLAELRPRLGILVKVCEAVAFAHSRQVVHRDLKPANIMVGEFGEVLVMDWGLARRVSEGEGDDEALRTDSAAGVVAGGDAPLTTQGAMLGTVGYVAPEQARGEAVDGRADVFSLGAVLVAILTGAPPIEGSHFQELLRATLGGQVKLPRARRPEVPPELDAIAARALAADREERYPTATALAADLGAFLEGRPVSVYRYGALEQARRFAKRHRTLVATTLAAVLTATIAAAVLAAKNVQLRRALVDLQVATDARVAAEKSRADAERARSLVARARSRARAGAPFAEVKALVDEALAIAKTEVILLEGGRALADTGDVEVSRETFLACARTFPPGYEALFAIHELERASTGRDMTMGLANLADVAHRRGDQNEYTDFAEATLFCAGKPERAIELLGVAIERAPRFVPAYTARAQVRLGMRDDAGALQDVERALEIEPLNFSALAGRSAIRIFREDPAGAIEDVTLAIAVQPRLGRLWTMRAMARHLRGEHDGALADATRGIELSSGDAASYAFRALVRIEKNDFAGAIADCDKALAADPKLAEAWQRRADARGRAQDYKGSDEDACKALELEPRSPYSLRVRCRARTFLGDTKGALADFDRLLELDPSQAADWQHRGWVRGHLGDLDGAIADFTKALELDPRSAETWGRRGYARAQKGDHRGAIGDLGKAAELDPNDVSYLRLRARSRRALGDWDGALADASRVIELLPTDHEGWADRGALHYARHDLDRAIGDLTGAIALDASFAEDFRLRGLAHAAQGDKAEARADLERFLALAKGSPEEAAVRAKLAELGR